MCFFSSDKKKRIKSVQPMSLIKRRKSPGWDFAPIKRTVTRVPRVSKPKDSKKVSKIVNPISKKKINLNGPTHKILIKAGI